MSVWEQCSPSRKVGEEVDGEEVEVGKYDIPKSFVMKSGGSQKKNLSREITWSDFNFSKLPLVGFNNQSINLLEV